jgi:hypothetical protein
MNQGKIQRYALKNIYNTVPEYPLKTLNQSRPPP